MRGPWVVAAALALGLLGGCAPAPVGCTAIGSVAGLGVTVDPGIAGEVSALRLTVCVAGTCRQHPVELAAGTRAEPGPCPTADPDSACSATLVPDGTLVGFVITELTEGPVRIAGRMVRDGRSVVLAPTEVRAAPTYPNGPACGAGAPQASVRVDAAGLH